MRRYGKLKIKNKTRLSYSEIGSLIDILSEEEDTIYIGKVDVIKIERNRKKYKVTIKYGLRDTTWIFEEEK